MLLFAAAIVAAMPGAVMPQAQPVPIQTIAPVCERPALQKVGKVGKRGAHNLSEEPSAKEFKAVLYTEGGCSKPIVVNDRIGNTPAGK